VIVNGRAFPDPTEPRRLLSDYLRHDLALTGTHVGCEHGVCGCCTVHLDGRPVRSCLLFAVQVGDLPVTTVEGLAPSGADLTYVQRAFKAEHGLQCGFCTPGFLMTVTAFLDGRDSPPTDAEIDEAISGNLCRCTGYAGIRRAVRRAWELR
jgi:carbon-monoxide dehydrogenase small subunit